MVSPDENRALYDVTFNMMTGHLVEFIQKFCTANLGANTIEHVSEMELYIILSTLEKFELWN